MRERRVTLGREGRGRTRKIKRTSPKTFDTDSLVKMLGRSLSFFFFRFPHYRHLSPHSASVSKDQESARRPVNKMDLRKVEQDLEKISSDWKSLRRQRPRFDGSTAAPPDATSCIINEQELSLSWVMPSWRELMSKVNDDEIFPPEEDDILSQEDGELEPGGDRACTIANDEHGKTGDEPPNFVDSEFGMCLGSITKDAEVDAANGNVPNVAGGSNSNRSIWDKYAAKNTVAEKSKVTQPVVKNMSENNANVSDSEEEEPMHVADASPETILAGLESLHERFDALGPKIDKFNTKLKEVSSVHCINRIPSSLSTLFGISSFSPLSLSNQRDPVTKKPRYGEKTIPRVKAAIRTYRALEKGADVLFNDSDAGPCLVSVLRSQIQQHTEKLNATIRARRSQEQLETERLVKERILAEERTHQQRLLEEQRKRDEERELARRAEEARMRRLEEERAVVDAEFRADQELMALVPILGADGVRGQIGRMREALKDDGASLDVALGSLYTLFEQIVRKPEEVNFRRVRRNHPKFMADIGRHVGGREVLIAAGFKLEKLDGVPSFFSAEPHIESDMDGWSEWFDTLKKTLAVIEEEMLK